MTPSSEDLLQTLHQYLLDAKLFIQELQWYPKRDSFLKDLEQSQHNLNEKFKIVIAGDYNSGKSYFINTLMGEMVAKVSNMPETDRVHIYRYGSQESNLNPEEIVWIHYKINPVLEHFDLVDTPGLNSGDSKHTKQGDFHGDMTREFIPSADMVFYVTSIVSPWSASGRDLLNYIYREKCRQIVLILNKIDIFDEPDPLNPKTPEEKVQETVHQVRFRCKEYLDLEPEILAVSCVRAYRAKTAKQQNRETIALFEKSRFYEVMDYIQSALNDVGRLRVKLLTGTHLNREIMQQIQQALVEEIHRVRQEKNRVEKELQSVQEVKQLPHELQQKLKDRTEQLLQEEQFVATLQKEFQLFWKSFKIGAKKTPENNGLEFALHDALDRLAHRLLETMDPFHREIHQKLELHKTWKLPKVRVPLENFVKKCFQEFTLGYLVPGGAGVFVLFGMMSGTHWLWFLSLLAGGGAGYYYTYQSPIRCFQELKEEIFRAQRNAMSPFREQIQEELEPTIQNLEMVLNEEIHRIRLQLEGLEEQKRKSDALLTQFTELHHTVEHWQG